MTRRYHGMMTVATGTLGTTRLAHVRVTDDPGDTAHGWPRLDLAAFPDATRRTLEGLAPGEYTLTVIEPEGDRP